MGCPICECQCQEPVCERRCYGHPFRKFNNTFGCQDCQCICPELNCDSHCVEIGFVGIPGPTDEAGCVTSCAGCVLKAEGM